MALYEALLAAGRGMLVSGLTDQGAQQLSRAEDVRPDRIEASLLLASLVESDAALDADDLDDDMAGDDGDFLAEDSDDGDVAALANEAGPEEAEVADDEDSVLAGL
jgi:hypothetical protein